MQMKFQILIDTDEAEPGEMAQAIKNRLDFVEMPNGDDFYIDSVQVDYLGPVSA